MRAESSLLYPNHESRNNGLRSPEETQRTVDLLLAELARAQKRADDLEEALDGLRGCYRDLEDRFELLLATVCSLKAGRLH